MSDREDDLPTINLSDGNLSNGNLSDGNLGDGGSDGAPPTEPHAPLGAPAPGDRDRARHRRVAGIALLTVIGFVGGYLITLTALDHHDHKSVAATTPTFPSSPTNPSSPTTPTTGPQPTDPDASALTNLGARQSDVTGGATVQLIQDGDRVTNETTLDLCNGTFPSESLRTARRQVAVADSQDDVVLSTEAVLYRNPDDGAQAMREVRSVAANCPTTPVPSPVGEPTVTTTFNPPPDASWPKVDGVQRLAYDFVTTDVDGTQQRFVSVYLQRGRALLGLYFPQSQAAAVPIAGKATVMDIVGLFEQRMAALPESVVNGTTPS